MVCGEVVWCGIACVGVVSVTGCVVLLHVLLLSGGLSSLRSWLRQCRRRCVVTQVTRLGFTISITASINAKNISVKKNYRKKITDWTRNTPEGRSATVKVQGLSFCFFFFFYFFFVLFRFELFDYLSFLILHFLAAIAPRFLVTFPKIIVESLFLRFLSFSFFIFLLAFLFIF